MTVTHDEKVVREFSKQAAGFADPALNVAFTRHLDRLVRFMDPELDLEDVVLEVAAGTGLVSRAIARRVRHVTALDLTPAMLTEGKRAADHAGLMNVTFAHGDAVALPYLDRSYTLVVTRFSLHQVADPGAVVREMVRVCRPGAALIIADLSRPDGLHGDLDRIERLRDPSHGTALTETQVADLVTSAGAEVKRAERFDYARPLDPWLRFSHTPADVAAQIRRDLEDELAGGPATGMRPSMDDGVLHFTHSYLFQQAIAG
ncbi:methyltransferase domain-containing protein [Actinomadura darangshiensis]|uniref:Methyltransferase domain-containing protein n=1 Tax=Actinomadura darangshiensis TaxID=705336 RepID=A0A4R4ZS38_9ACTN|nr:methyltransferase domain-containing protein [Actinomadura darangshiensis]TDD60914.1 methyltransferase domain-containing protein [Actinomadura darangshiensis]